MEVLRFTRLFPVIGSMDDRLRLQMIWITFTILFSLACVESALAFMRDQIAMDLSALRYSLSAGGVAQVVEVTGVNNWIPMVGQMVMGFILPFALTFVTIPLESLANSSCSVLGDLPFWVEKTVLTRIRQNGKKNDEPIITLEEHEVGVGQVMK